MRRSKPGVGGALLGLMSVIGSAATALFCVTYYGGIIEQNREQYERASANLTTTVEKQQKLIVSLQRSLKEEKEWNNRPEWSNREKPPIKVVANVPDLEPLPEDDTGTQEASIEFTPKSWASKDNSKTVNARLVGFSPDFASVHLVRDDNLRVEVALSDLSEPDQEFCAGLLTTHHKPRLVLSPNVDLSALYPDQAGVHRLQRALEVFANSVVDAAPEDSTEASRKIAFANAFEELAKAVYGADASLCFSVVDIKLGKTLGPGKVQAHIELSSPVSQLSAISPDGKTSKLATWLVKAEADAIKQGSLVQLRGTLNKPSRGAVGGVLLRFPILEFATLASALRETTASNPLPHRTVDVPFVVESIRPIPDDEAIAILNQIAPIGS